MPTIHILEKEKLRPIVDLFLKSSADFNKFPTQYKRPMRLIMSENIPLVCLGDGFFFMEAFFTKEAINDFRKNFSHLKLSNLRDKFLYVQRWSLHVRQRDSNREYCTYNNLTVILCVE